MEKNKNQEEKEEEKKSIQGKSGKVRNKKQEKKS